MAGELLNGLIGLDHLISSVAPWGELHKQRAAQTQIEQGQAQTTQLQAQNAQQSQNAAADSMNLSEGALNSGFNDPISKSNPRFWSDLEPDEQQHVLGQYSSVDPKFQHVIPDAYNSWVQRQYHVLPNLMMPRGMDSLMSGGTASAAQSGGVSFGLTGFRTDDKGQMVPQYGPLVGGFSPAQMAVIKQGPEAVAGSQIFHPLARDKAVEAAKTFDTTRKEYRDQVLKTPAIQNYLTGSGEQAGILPLWRDVDAFRQKHANGSDLSPQEATTLVYRLGRIDNPGAIVRQQEFETIAKNAGVYDSIMASLQHAAAGKSRIPATVVNDIYNVVDQLKGSAQQRAHEAMASWEPELARRGLELGDVIHDAPALKDYRQQFGQVMGPQHAATLPQGTPYIGMDGGRRVASGEAAQPPGQGAPPPGSGALPPLSGPAAGFQALLKQSMAQQRPGGAAPGTMPNLNFRMVQPPAGSPYGSNAQAVPAYDAQAHLQRITGRMRVLERQKATTGLRTNEEEELNGLHLLASRLAGQGGGALPPLSGMALQPPR